MAPPLSRGTCPEAGLDADEIGLIVPELAAALEAAPAGDAGLPWCAGAVVLVGRGPVVALHEAVGWAVRYRSYDDGAGRGVELPAAERVPMRPGTVFDLASLTKLFTAVAAVLQIEAGALDPDR